MVRRSGAFNITEPVEQLQRGDPATPRHEVWETVPDGAMDLRRSIMVMGGPELRPVRVFSAPPAVLLCPDCFRPYRYRNS